MTQLIEFIDEYAELEGKIRHLMVSLFSETCGMCTACCCRADICEEAIESSFLLLLLKKQGLSEAKMDEKYGWLDLHGCSLEFGRPPVCYSYYCDELVARIPDDETRFATKVLGNLIHHIGLSALGDSHLVEIMTPEGLEKLDFNHLFQRMEEARTAFEVIQEYMGVGRLTRAERIILDRITLDEPE